MNADELGRLAPFRLVRKQEFPMEWVLRSRVGEDIATFEDETCGQAVMDLLNGEPNAAVPVLKLSDERDQLRRTVAILTAANAGLAKQIEELKGKPVSHD